MFTEEHKNEFIIIHIVDEELPEFPVDKSLLVAVQARVNAARQLESLEHTQRRSNAEEGWLAKAAKELDLHFDQHDKLYPFTTFPRVIIVLFNINMSCSLTLSIDLSKYALTLKLTVLLLPRRKHYNLY
jgi:hypothetical protein